MPVHSDADDSADPNVEVASPAPHAATTPPAERDPVQDRRPLANSGQYLLPLILSGVIATIMVVAFVSGFESIFPGAPAPVTPATVPATTSEAAGTTAPPAEGSDTKPAPSTAPPAASETSDEAAPADSKAGSEPGDSSEKKTSGRQKLLFSPFLASLVLVQPAEAPDAASSDRPGPFGRLMIYIKFVVLILLGVGCGMVALGGLALSMDRPLGSPATAASRMFLAGWLTTLALLIPAPYTWMLEPLHYIVGALIFWVSIKFLFRLSFQQAAMLLGATMSLLAITVLGSWVVLWAAWG